MKLDICCGNNKQKGFKGIDIAKDSQADIVWNVLETPWPIKDGEVTEAFCSHYLEHIPHGNGFQDPFWDFFNELYRVMKKGATATFVTPYYSSIRAWQDPTHQRAISEPTYMYLDKKWRKLNKLEHYPIKANFKVVNMNHAPNGVVAQGKSQEALAQMAMLNINVIDDISVTIKKH